MNKPNKALELLRKADVVQIECGPYIELGLSGDDQEQEFCINGDEENQGMYFFSREALEKADILGNRINVVDVDGDNHMIHCYKVKECTL